MNLVVLTEEDLRRIIREETRELREALSGRGVAAKADTLLTVQEVAQRCSVKETTVRTWIHRGALAARRAGHRYLVARDDLSAFVETSKATPSVPHEEHLSLLIKRLNEAEGT